MIEDMVQQCRMSCSSMVCRRARDIADTSAVGGVRAERNGEFSGHSEEVRCCMDT